MLRISTEVVVRSLFMSFRQLVVISIRPWHSHMPTTGSGPNDRVVRLYLNGLSTQCLWILDILNGRSRHIFLVISCCYWYLYIYWIHLVTRETFKIIVSSLFFIIDYYLVTEHWQSVKCNYKFNKKIINYYRFWDIDYWYNLFIFLLWRLVLCVCVNISCYSQYILANNSKLAVLRPC